MIEDFEPRYITIPVRTLRAISRLNKQDRLAFIDHVWTAYNGILSNNLETCYPDSTLGDCMKEADKEIASGYNAYKTKVFANPSGKTKEKGDAPIGVPIGIPIGNPNQSDQNQKRSEYNHQINQIRSELAAEGYGTAQIDTILTRTNLQQVKNPKAYIKKAIEEEKKKRLPEQNYGQRDYSEPIVTLEELMERINNESTATIPDADEANNTLPNPRPP